MNILQPTYIQAHLETMLKRCLNPPQSLYHGIQSASTPNHYPHADDALAALHQVVQPPITWLWRSRRPGCGWAQVLVHAIDFLELIALPTDPDLLLQHLDSDAPITFLDQLGICRLLHREFVQMIECSTITARHMQVETMAG